MLTDEQISLAVIGFNADGQAHLNACLRAVGVLRAGGVVVDVQAISTTSPVTAISSAASLSCPSWPNAGNAAQAVAKEPRETRTSNTRAGH